MAIGGLSLVGGGALTLLSYGAAVSVQRGNLSRLSPLLSVSIGTVRPCPPWNAAPSFGPRIALMTSAMGRDRDHAVVRGVADASLLCEHGVNCSLSSNNILNPATPYGDCSLIRMANLYSSQDRLILLPVDSFCCSIAVCTQS
jgi:hypothetical protein